MAPVLDLFPPVVARWFTEVFGEPTRPPGWPTVAASSDTLGCHARGVRRTFQGTP